MKPTSVFFFGVSVLGIGGAILLASYNQHVVAQTRTTSTGLTTVNESGNTVDSTLPGIPQRESTGDTKSQVISIEKNSADVTQAVNGQEVKVNGNSNNVVLQGTTGQLTIQGNANDVSVDRVRTIHFRGNGNQVVYHELLEGVRPKVVSEGSGNAVSRH